LTTVCVRQYNKQYCYGLKNEIVYICGWRRSYNTKGVSVLIGCHRVALQYLVKLDVFSKPIRLGNKNFWKKSDIEAYIESKKVNASEPKPEQNEAANE
jgi:predicted DNA-binding transcriptional regulator AlpA